MPDTLTALAIAARFGLDLPDVSGPLAIRSLEDRIEDAFGLIRADTSPAVEIAVIHDGSDHGIAEAVRYSRLLGLAPVMMALLAEALGAWESEFDGLGEDDPSVPGSDVAEWFASWRRSVRADLVAAVDSR